ncbi:hypothetical protein Godav_010140, partial [Gossypium davidsonii]|nr:hypothetical protein [Gossypium davidsonii]
VVLVPSKRITDTFDSVLIPTEFVFEILLKVSNACCKDVLVMLMVRQWCDVLIFELDDWARFKPVKPQNQCDPILHQPLRRLPDRPTKNRRKDVDETRGASSSTFNRLIRKWVPLNYTKCCKVGNYVRTYKSEVGGNPRRLTKEVEKGKKEIQINKMKPPANKDLKINNLKLKATKEVQLKNFKPQPTNLQLLKLKFQSSKLKLGDSLISWRSKKQTVVARSSTESEYRATTLELLWLHQLLEDMGLSSPTATILHCDNCNAIQIAHNDFGTEEAKESSMGTYDYQHVPFVGVEDDAHKFQRKVLHEVHSGPNPISNSVPQQRLKTKLRKILP